MAVAAAAEPRRKYLRFIILFSRCVLLVEVVQFRRRHLTVVDQYSVPECEGLALRYGPASVLVLVMCEFAPAERVGREQAVGAGVPRGRVPEARGRVENGNSDRLTRNRAGVAYPFGRFAPDLLL